MDTIVYTTWKSPIGKLLIASTDSGVVCISTSMSVQELKDSYEASFAQKESSKVSSSKAVHHLDNAEKALEAYFHGDMTALKRVKVELHGTEFEQDVWNEMRNIGCGKPTSYGALARKVGRPKAARAVGAACRKNPVLVVVPCHRVIGSNKSLTGFAAGLDRKKALLEHEGYQA